MKKKATIFANQANITSVSLHTIYIKIIESR